MPSYVTIAEFIGSLSQDVLDAISDDDGSGAYDADVAEQALEAAESFVESYVRAYLPFATVPASIKNAVFAVGAHFLRAPRGISTEDSTMLYKDTRDWLVDVSNGKASLGIDEDADPATDPLAPEVDAQDRVFGRDMMRAF